MTDQFYSATGGVEWRSHIVLASDLKTAKFPPIQYVIPGILPEGLSILAGRPKVGKSWMALEMCLGVAGDHHVLGGIRPDLGDVLYCALEDTPQRLQRRIRKLNYGVWPDRLTLATKWRRLDAGGTKDIGRWARSVLCPRLVVLDTLARVRPERNVRDTQYDGGYKAAAELHALANEMRFAVLMLHHLRKQEADDPFDLISGTLGLVGCADTGIILQRGPQGTTLYMRGRDIEESEQAISFSSDTCRWTLLGEAVEVRRSDTRKQIMAALENADALMSPDDIHKATGIKLNTVHQQLPKMLRDGEVVRAGQGKYAHPSREDLLKR